MYLYIFVASWVVAFVLVQLREHRKNAAVEDHFRANWNVSEAQISSFKQTMSSPKVMLIKLWASFFLGSLLGCVLSAVYWLLSHLG
jgi:hypothetical protein